MNQYEDQKRRNQNQEIEHGLGIGGGRGRPKGSRNGYISPGAAYMKDYEIIGQRVDPNQKQPQGRNAQMQRQRNITGTGTVGQRGQAVGRNPVGANTNKQRIAALKQATMKDAKLAKPMPAPRNNNVDWGKVLEGVTGGGPFGQKATRTAVELGREVMNQLNGGGSYDSDRLTNRGRPVDTSTNVVANPDISGAIDDGRTIERNDLATGQASSKPVDNEYQREMEYNSRQTVYPQQQTSGLKPQINANPAPRQNMLQQAGQAARNSFAANQGKAWNNAMNQIGQARSKSVDNEYQREMEYNSRQNVYPQQMGEQVLREQVIPEQIISEQVLPEQKLTESRPAQTGSTQEPPKTFWDGLLDWGNQAAKDIGDFATRAIDTGKAAYNTAAGWVNDRVNDVGSWAGTAYKDVSDWIGDRGRDLDRLWNGYDEKGPYGNPAKRSERLDTWPTHVKGLRENIGDAVNQAGEWIGDTAKNVGQAVTGAVDQAGKALFGYDHPTYQIWNEGKNPPMEHENGFFENVGNAVTGAAEQAGRALFGYDQPNGQIWNQGTQPPMEHVNGFFDNAGNWISNAAQNVGNAATNAWNGATQWAGQAAQDVGNAVTGAANQAGRWIGETAVQRVVDAYGNVRDAVVDGYGNVVGYLETAGQTARDWVGQRGEELNDWWNGTDKISGRRTVNDVYGARENIRGDYDPNDTTDRRQVVRDEVNVEHTPGFRENAAQALNEAGKRIGETAGNIGRAIGETAGNAGKAVNENVIQPINQAVVQPVAQAASIGSSPEAISALQNGMPLDVLYALSTATQSSGGRLEESTARALINEFNAGYTSLDEIRNILEQVNNQYK